MREICAYAKSGTNFCQIEEGTENYAHAQMSERSIHLEF